MKRRFLIAASLLFVLLTLAIPAGSSRFAPAVSALERGAKSVQASDCGGEPCDAVVRGHRAFFDRGLDGLGANGRACADCHMATNHFQLSPPMSKPGSESFNYAAGEIRTPTIRCSVR